MVNVHPSYFLLYKKAGLSTELCSASKSLQDFKIWTGKTLHNLDVPNIKEKFLGYDKQLVSQILTHKLNTEENYKQIHERVESKLKDLEKWLSIEYRTIKETKLELEKTVDLKYDNFKDQMEICMKTINSIARRCNINHRKISCCDTLESMDKFPLSKFVGDLLKSTTTNATCNTSGDSRGLQNKQPLSSNNGQHHQNRRALQDDDDIHNCINMKSLPQHASILSAGNNNLLSWNSIYNQDTDIMLHNKNQTYNNNNNNNNNNNKNNKHNNHNCRLSPEFNRSHNKVGCYVDDEDVVRVDSSLSLSPPSGATNRISVTIPSAMMMVSNDIHKDKKNNNNIEQISSNKIIFENRISIPQDNRKVQPIDNISRYNTRRLNNKLISKSIK